MNSVRKDEEMNNGNAKMVECHYKGTVMMVPVKVFQSIAERAQYDNRKFVRYKEGAQIYGMSEREFMKLAQEAKAVYKRNRMALISLEVLDKYMESFRE